MDADDHDPVYVNACVFALCLARLGGARRVSGSAAFLPASQRVRSRTPARDEAARVPVRGIVVVRVHRDSCAYS